MPNHANFYQQLSENKNEAVFIMAIKRSTFRRTVPIGQCRYFPFYLLWQNAKMEMCWCFIVAVTSELLIEHYVTYLVKRSGMKTLAKRKHAQCSKLHKGKLISIHSQKEDVQSGHCFDGSIVFHGPQSCHWKKVKWCLVLQDNRMFRKRKKGNWHIEGVFLLRVTVLYNQQQAKQVYSIQSQVS